MSFSSAGTIIDVRLALMLLIASCDTHQAPEIYRTPDKSQEWSALLNELDAPLDPVLPTVLLVAPPTHCQSCLDELSLWMRDYWTYPIRLVWISPAGSEDEVSQFLETQKFLFPVRTWINGDPKGLGLLPFTPAKILFGPDRQIRRIHVLGGDPDVEAFFEALRD